MVTQIQIDEEAHIICIEKQMEFRKKKLGTPSITTLVNNLIISNMKNVPVK